MAVITTKLIYLPPVTATAFELRPATGALRSLFRPSARGVYGYPLRDATRIAIAETLAFLARSALLEKVVFACFPSANVQIYEEVLAELS